MLPHFQNPLLPTPQKETCSLVFGNHAVALLHMCITLECIAGPCHLLLPGVQLYVDLFKILFWGECFLHLTLHL